MDAPPKLASTQFALRNDAPRKSALMKSALVASGAGKVAPRRERLAKVRLAEEGVDEPRVGEVGA